MTGECGMGAGQGSVIRECDREAWQMNVAGKRGKGTWQGA